MAMFSATSTDGEQEGGGYYWPCPMPSSAREEEVCPSSPKKGRVMTMVISFLSAGDSCRGDHGRSSREEEVCSGNGVHLKLPTKTSSSEAGAMA